MPTEKSPMSGRKEELVWYIMIMIAITNEPQKNTTLWITTSKNS